MHHLNVTLFGDDKAILKQRLKKTVSGVDRKTKRQHK